MKKNSERLLVIFSLCISSVILHGQTDNQASIQINLGKNLGQVNRLLFGNNQMGYQYHTFIWKNVAHLYADKGAGIWDPEKKCPVPEMVGFAKDIGMSGCRWPGGSGVNYFIWKKCVGPLSERTNQLFGLPEFLAFCESINALPIITVAEYYGDAQDAADLVEYLNVPDDGKHKWAALRTRDGHKEPYNVVWFEFGNESYANYAGKSLKANKLKDEYKIFTAKEYAINYLEYRKAMQAVDKNIKLGIVDWDNNKSWLETILKVTKENSDFVIPHFYFPWYTANDGKPDAQTLYAISLAGMLQTPFFFSELKEIIKKTTGRQDVPFLVTEYKGWYDQAKPVPYRFCLGSALVVAEHLRMYMQIPDIAQAYYWSFANEHWGMVKGYQKPYTFRPDYWVMYLYKNHFGDDLVEATVQCGTYDSPGGFNTMPAYGKPTYIELFDKNLMPEQQWGEIGIDEKTGKWLTQREEDGVLIVDFNTTEDQNYFHADKRLPAEPNTGYRVTAEIMCSGMENSKGGYVMVGDARGWGATRSAKESSEIKENEWTKVKADYITLPDTTAIKITARCKATGVGTGTMQIRNVRVYRFTPNNTGAAPFLAVNASKSKDNSKAYLMVVNKNMQSAVETKINDIPAAGAKAWCLTGPSVDAVNEVNPENVSVKPLEVQNNGGNVFTVSLPPFSMTAVEFEMKK